MRKCVHGKWRRRELGALCSDANCERTLSPLKCFCDAGWIGELCDQKKCANGPNGKMCTDNGVCVNGECSCNEDYMGTVCDQHVCNKRGDFDNDTCTCFDTFWGEHCERKMCRTSSRD